MARDSGTRSSTPQAASAPVAVVIPTWNGRQHLERCLPALFAQTWQDFQVILVDNGSTDGTLPWVKGAHPRVQVVGLERNHGFARACNEGIQATTAPLVITLNNDTVPQPQFLAELMSAANHAPGVGMFAATLWREGEPAVVDSAGFEVNRLGVAWNALEGRQLPSLPPEPRPVLGPCAGAALYRRSMLDDIGLFDESYFAYLEDVELAWRARWAGWSCLWVPAATTWHAHSATGGLDLPRKYWLLGRNRLRTLVRHYPRPYLWYHLPLIAANEMLTGLLAAIALRHPAPILGRLSALHRAGSAYPARQRITPAEAFRLLDPLPTPGSMWVRYAGSRRRGRRAGAAESSGRRG